jgi:hypothetical protein
METFDFYHLWKSKTMPLNAQQSFIAASQCLDLDQPQTGDFLSRRRDDEDLPFLAAMTARHIPTLQGTYQAIEGAAVFPRHLGDQNQG